MAKNTEDLRLLACQLDQSGAYRALARFTPQASWGTPESLAADDDPVRLMVVTTDGFELQGRRWVCRLSYVVADFEPGSGIVWRVSGRYDSLHDPRRAAPQGALEALGLSESSLRSQSIDRARVENDLAQVSLVVSHQAAVDRPALEFISSAFRNKHWACSSSLDWGYGSSDLEVLLMRRAGQFIAGSTSLMRCEALLHLLALRPDDVGGTPMLVNAMSAAKARSYRVWVDALVFERHSQALVSAGFRPQRQEVDPRKSAPIVGWAKDVHGDLEQELAFLDGLGIRAGIVVDVVTGRERFTGRFRSQMTPVYESHGREEQGVGQRQRPVHQAQRGSQVPVQQRH